MMYFVRVLSFSYHFYTGDCTNSTSLPKGNKARSCWSASGSAVQFKAKVSELITPTFCVSATGR